MFICTTWSFLAESSHQTHTTHSSTTKMKLYSIIFFCALVYQCVYCNIIETDFDSIVYERMNKQLPCSLQTNTIVVTFYNVCMNLSKHETLVYPEEEKAIIRCSKNFQHYFFGQFSSLCQKGYTKYGNGDSSNDAYKVANEAIAMQDDFRFKQDMIGKYNEELNQHLITHINTQSDISNIYDKFNSITILFSTLGNEWYKLLKSAKDNQLNDVLFNRYFPEFANLANNSDLSTYTIDGCLFNTNYRNSYFPWNIMLNVTTPIMCPNKHFVNAKAFTFFKVENEKVLFCLCLFFHLIESNNSIFLFHLIALHHAIYRACQTDP